jgi:hypothetical protein
MEQINEIKIKVCRICGSSENKFEAKRHQCNKCMSKKRYEINKKKDYFNNYYNNNREVILEQQRSYYHRKINKYSEENSLKISE